MMTSGSLDLGVVDRSSSAESSRLVATLLVDLRRILEGSPWAYEFVVEESRHRPSLLARECAVA